MAVENKYKVKDEALFAEVQKLKDGASGDYNLLYELSEKYIYKIINDIVKNHHTTEDLMQETYLQIYNKIDTLQDAKAFYVWAGRIATNLTLRHVQKYRKETLAVADEEGSTDFVFDVATDDNECFIPENVLMDKEKQRLIAEIIDNLSIEQKLSVQYFYYEEMSVRDIAHVMGCSEGTVKSRLNYARKSIKDAVIDLDVKQGTRLYSLGTLPLFWLVFRESVESFVIAGATAAAGVAGGVAGAVGGTSSVGTAGAVAGSVRSAGTGMAGTVAGGAGSAGTGGGIASTVASVGNAGATSVAGGAVGGSAGAVGTAGGASAVGSAGATASTGASVAAGSAASTGATAGSAATAATAGTVASTGTTAGSAASTGAAVGATKAATGLGAKFFGTAAGKAVAGVAAAAVVIGGGAAVVNQVKNPEADGGNTVNTESTDVIASEDSNSSDILPSGVTTEGVENTLYIRYDYQYDINNREYWETSNLYVNLEVGSYIETGQPVISEDAYYIKGILSGGIQQFFDEQASEEEVRAFFDEYQYIGAENKEPYEMDVTEDFPETFEFDIDGVHFTANIRKVGKVLYFQPNLAPGKWMRKAYTASYQGEFYEGQMEELYAAGVNYYIIATYSCDKDILTVKYAKDAEGTYLFGEPQEELPVDNSIRLEYIYKCDAMEPDYLNGFFSDGEIYDNDLYAIFTETKDQASEGAPDGIYEFFSANISEEKVQEFFETYQYTAAQKGGYWEDISATMPKTMEFDYDDKHYVVEIKDLQMGIYFMGYYPADGLFYTAKEVESNEYYDSYASGVTFEVVGTYTCDSIDSSAE